jgi:tetratricopeptide (TPR) repeat protein
MLFLAVVVVFSPSFVAGFIWDDDAMLTRNSLIRGPLSNFWFTTQPIDYFPLTYSSLWVEWRLWGMNPTGYHITNVVLHALSCIILWRAFIRLKISAAWLAALLFAIHPVNFESVAWIAERKNVLAMFFYSITVWAFVRFVQSRERRFYIVSLLAFLLSLLAKPAAAPWPMAALVIAYCCERTVSGTTTLNLRKRLKKYSIWTAPFFATTILLSVATVAFQYGNAITADVRTRFDADILTRLARAEVDVWFYLSKAIVPYPLLFVYPKWSFSNRLLALVPCALLIALFVILLKFRRSWSKVGLFAVAYYVLLLTPVLGFFNIYFQRYSYVADHWQYFALPAITVLIAFYLKKARLHYFAGPALVLIFASLTFMRCGAFHDSDSVWQDTLAKDPKCCLALNQLAVNCTAAGKLEEATNYYFHSLELDPNEAQTHVNLGYCQVLMEKADDGIAQIGEAIRIDPSFSYAYYYLGLALRKQGKIDEAIAGFREAIRLNPTFAPSYDELATTVWSLGQRDEAISLLRHALVKEPDDVGALIHLGNFLTDIGKSDEGLPFLQKAIALEPKNADARIGLGNNFWSANQANAAQDQFAIALQIDPSSASALYAMATCLRLSGQNNEAAKLYEQLLAQNPQQTEAHFQLAMLLVVDKKTQNAIDHFREAARLKPNWFEPFNNLARVLATVPNPIASDRAEAVRLAEHAVELTGGTNAMTLDTLGVAWARTDDFTKASEAAHRAINAARTSGRSNLIPSIEKRISLYEKHVAYIGR